MVGSTRVVYREMIGHHALFAGFAAAGAPVADGFD
jgi:hypothetical protein